MNIFVLARNLLNISSVVKPMLSKFSSNAARSTYWRETDRDRERKRERDRQRERERNLMNYHNVVNLSMLQSSLNTQKITSQNT